MYASRLTKQKPTQTTPHRHPKTTVAPQSGFVLCWTRFVFGAMGAMGLDAPLWSAGKSEAEAEAEADIGHYLILLVSCLLHMDTSYAPVSEVMPMVQSDILPGGYRDHPSHLPFLSTAVRLPFFIFTFCLCLCFCSFFFVGYPSIPPLPPVRQQRACHDVPDLLFFSFSSSAT